MGSSSVLTPPSSFMLWGSDSGHEIAAVEQHDVGGGRGGGGGHILHKQRQQQAGQLAATHKVNERKSDVGPPERQAWAQHRIEASWGAL